MPSTGETPAGPATPAPSQEAAEVRALVAGYVAAITSRDEPAAARFTCQRTDGGLLWVTSAGRPISVHGVEVGGTMAGSLSAMVEVRVDGKPPSPVVLLKKDGAWCVWR